jgi:hypothetical protein
MNHEHEAAVALVIWWAYESRRRMLPEHLLHAIPNGSARHIVVAMKLKAEGVRKGVSDYFLAVPRNGRHGLYLELKAGGVGVKKGTKKAEQIQFGADVIAQGYAFAFAYGALEAEKIIEEYLGPWKKTP